MNRQQLDDLLRDDSKLSVILDSYDVANLAQASNGSFKHKILGEKVLSEHLSFIILGKKDILSSIFSQKMMELVESGIAKKTIDDAISWTPKIKEDEPEILLLSHVEPWFIIWACSLVISLIVFMMEKLCGQRIEKMTATFQNLLQKKDRAERWAFKSLRKRNNFKETFRNK